MAEWEESNLCGLTHTMPHRRMATIVIAPAAVIRIEQAEHDQVERPHALYSARQVLSDRHRHNALLMFVDAPVLCMPAMLEFIFLMYYQILPLLYFYIYIYISIALILLRCIASWTDWPCVFDFSQRRSWQAD